MMLEKLENCPECNHRLGQSEYDFQKCGECGWGTKGRRVFKPEQGLSHFRKLKMVADPTTFESEDGPDWIRMENEDGEFAYIFTRHTIQLTAEGNQNHE